MDIGLEDALIDILKRVVPPDDVYTTLYKAIHLLCCIDDGMSDRCLDVQEEIDDIIARYYIEIEKTGAI